MREQLIQYVELLFAGAKDCEDIKQEILQNTLDRYDDLIAEGKFPEAAYRLAITGIGDINEILGTKKAAPVYQPADVRPEKQDPPVKKLLRAIAVALYILSPTPLFILSEMGMDTIGLCGTLSIIAVATVLIILGGKREAPKAGGVNQERAEPQDELSRSIGGLIWAVCLVLYFILSFATHAWHVTWVLFLIAAAIQGLVKAIMSTHSRPVSPIQDPSGPRAELRRSITGAIWALGLALYFIISFATGAWYVTWVLFLIIGAIQGLAKAIIDLKEAMEYEN